MDLITPASLGRGHANDEDVSPSDAVIHPRGHHTQGLMQQRLGIRPHQSQPNQGITRVLQAGVGAQQIHA